MLNKESLTSLDVQLQRLTDAVAMNRDEAYETHKLLADAVEEMWDSGVSVELLRRISLVLGKCLDRAIEMVNTGKCENAGLYLVVYKILIALSIADKEVFELDAEKLLNIIENARENARKST